MRRAVDMLVEEGRLRREQGRGTFVTTPPLTPMFFRLSSFDEEMQPARARPRHKAAGAARSIPATEQIAADLALHPGEDVIEIARLRLADGQPMAFETRYIGLQALPGPDA